MPGETYYTLKEKATTQAKKAGMSRDAAEKYGTARANVSASVAAGDKKGSGSQIGTKDDPGFYGGKAKEDGKGIDRLLPKELVGIAGTKIDKVKEDLKIATRARKRAQKHKEERKGVYDPKQGKVVYPKYDTLGILNKLGDISEKISDYSGFPLTALGWGAEIFKSFGLNKKDIIKKILNKEPLSRNEEQAIAGFLAAQKANPNVLPDVMEYYDDEDNKFSVSDPEGIFRSGLGLGEKYWEGFKSDEEYERMINEYYEGKPTGLGSLFGEERTKGKTGEELLDELSSGEEHYLRTNRPDLYYKLTGTPQTSGGIADLAGQQLMSTEGLGGEDLQKAKDFNQQVFNARNDLDRIQGDRGGGGGGIMGAAPAAFTDVNNNGVPDYLETSATGAPATATGITGATDALANIGSGNIGYVDPNTGQYTFGNIPSYSQYAQYTPSSWNDGGIVGLERGGYLDDYNAADSLMFKDPQEDEEWEYNV